MVNEKEDYSLMIGSAVRYALGRSTYIVDDTINYVKRNVNNLTDRALVVMSRDIKYEIELWDRCEKLRPSICQEHQEHKAQWIKLREFIENELKKRGCI